MDKNYGATFADLRRGKSFTLKEACQDDVSTAQLSRFEHGLSEVTLPVFLKLLANINVSIEEFFFVHQYYHESPLLTTLKEMSTAINAGDEQGLAAVRLALTQKNPSPHSWEQYYLHFIDAITELTLQEKQPALPRPKLEQSTQAVKNYLLQVDSWGEMELKLYAFFSFSFDPETTYQLFKTAIKRSKMYQSLKTDQALIFDILHNNFSAFLYYGRLDWAQETLTIFSEQFSSTDLLSPQIWHLADKAVLAIHQKKEETAQQTFAQAISICKIFKQTATEATIRRLFKEHWDNRDNPDFKTVTININFPTANR